jgi:hypothetical protein
MRHAGQLNVQQLAVNTRQLSGNIQQLSRNIQQLSGNIQQRGRRAAFGPFQDHGQELAEQHTMHKAPITLAAIEHRLRRRAGRSLLRPVHVG